jgi:hypothetical protein
VKTDRALEIPLLIPVAVLEEARVIFEDRGVRGCEGTALIAAGDRGVRLVVPEQTASPAGLGASVRVDLAGQLELAAALESGERYVSRIHSHPVEAFHSAADNANPVLTHRGALSIVVPYFGLGLRDGLDACAVLRFDQGRWHNLPPGVARSRWVDVVGREVPR